MKHRLEFSFPSNRWIHEQKEEDKKVANSHRYSSEIRNLEFQRGSNQRVPSEASFFASQSKPKDLPKYEYPGVSKRKAPNLKKKKKKIGWWGNRVMIAGRTRFSVPDRGVKKMTGAKPRTLFSVADFKSWMPLGMAFSEESLPLFDCTFSRERKSERELYYSGGTSSRGPRRGQTRDQSVI